MDNDKLKAQGERLRLVRNKLGLKLRDIADAIEIAVSAVGRWETGKQAIPVARLKNICTEYNVNRAWLETGEGEMFLPKEEPDINQILRDHIVKMVKELPEVYQEFWCECAEAILKAKNVHEAIKRVNETFEKTHETRKVEFSGNNSTNTYNEIRRWNR